MIRIFHAYFPPRTLVLGVTEAFAVMLAFVVATILWFGVIDADLILVYERGFLKILLVSGIFTVCMYYFDLYDRFVLSSRREVLTRFIQVLGTVSVIQALLYYAYPPLRLGRGIFLIGILLGALLVLAGRQLFLVLNSWPRFAERAVILGNGPLAQQLISELQRRSELGITVVRWISEDRSSTSAADVSCRESGLVELSQLAESQRIRRVIVTMGDRRGKMPVELLLQLRARGVEIQDGAELYERVTGKAPLESLRLSWLLFSPSFYSLRPLLLYKRLFSIVFSAVGLLVSWPVMLLIALAIRLDSSGRVIFRQKRVGMNGKIFTLYKFRSMYEDVDRNGDLRPVQERDDRVTRVGRWLRRTRLDELPQLYNILRGDMYFVGPRPFVLEQEEELAQQIPFYRQRWTVKPGATGWAQIHRGYCATVEDNAEKLAYDMFYIKNMSIGLDLLILFQTIKILLLGRGGR